ncbi:hypothetical protein [Ornithinimicrobium flavum]|uniref:hypothetical protein n=1 Tax=Ornithinimicrobium flavum TaxID=1288636 RepID=UPI00106FD78D|nr:hypothetical protein [Ornithinimicrobium flavum]
MTSYKNNLQTYRLVERIRSLSPDGHILVSHDRKADPLDSSVLAAAGAQWVRTPRAVIWGDGSYLDSLLAALALANTGRPNDWYTLLTAQDYPLHPLTDYELHLAKVGADALMEAPGQGADYEFVLQRYLSRSFAAPDFVKRPAVLRMTTKVIHRIPGITIHPQPHGLSPRIDVRRRKTPFGKSLQLHKGNDLFALNGRALAHLLSAPASLLEYFRRTRIPSEAFPHTVLRNGPLVVRSELLHYSVWEGNHPLDLEESALPDALASGRWFARKFAPDSASLAVLDARFGPHEGGARRDPAQ